MQKENHQLDPNRIVNFERFRSRILEKLVKNSPLPELLHDIVTGIEALNPSMICSIVLIEDAKIKIGVANSLPKSFNEAIEGIPIGPNVGSCGTAAYTGKRVIVEDIDTSPLWKDYKEIALGVGLLSCWSEPIRSHMDTVIGTFAIYQKSIASPTDYDIFIISETAGLVSIAIEKSITSSKLTESEKRFRDFFEKNSSVILIIEPVSGDIYDANKSAVLFYGYPHTKLTKMNIDDINIMNSDDLKKERMLALTEGKSFFIFSHQLANGEIKQVEVYSTPIETQKRTLLFSIIHDVTERNIAEEKVKSLLLEKEMILREVHHRIKNNMSILNNLLEQQARSHQNEEIRNSLHEATSRIKTMSVLYDKLYLGRTIEDLPLNEYLEPLTKEIISLFPYPVQLSFDVPNIRLSSEQLQAIGIITNELLTNSLKYGREEAKDLEIQIKVWKEDPLFFLLIRDNGTGFTLDPKNADHLGFGLTLVRMLTKQIKADLTFNGEQGAEYRFKIPIQNVT